MAISRAEMNRLLRRLEKPVQEAFASAVSNARSRSQIKALERAIISGDIDTILLAAGVRDGMWSTFSESIRSAYTQAGQFAMGAGPAKRLLTEFNINNPRAENWLRIQSSQRITGFLMPEVRASIQTMLENAMFKGLNPRTTALDIVGRIGANGKRTGGVIGLSQPQTQWVINMGDDLDNLDWSRYKTRTLRDRRFDSTVRKAAEAGRPIPAKTRNKIIQSYENRLIKSRGDTIGRTETLRAINESADEALRQVVEDGLVPREAITRIWRHSYSANERPGHKMMDGDERGLDESFTNPLTGATLRFPNDPYAPPDETINCRCYLEQKIDFIAVERAA